MSRGFLINGESMVSVTGPANSPIIAVPQQLGLASDPISVTLYKVSKPLVVDAYGQDNPVDRQVFGGSAVIEMKLIHFDPVILAECVRLTFPGAPTEGTLGRAGSTYGASLVIGAPGSSFITLSIVSPVAGLPYTFLTAYLDDRPLTIPLGTEKSITTLTWRAIAYSIDPWNAGLGSRGIPLYTRTSILGVANPT